MQKLHFFLLFYKNHRVFYRILQKIAKSRNRGKLLITDYNIYNGKMKFSKKINHFSQGGGTL